MSIPNDLTAKVLGDIIAKGMSISGFDIDDRVKTEAMNALDEIRLVMYNKNTDEKGKIRSIKNIMNRYNIKCCEK